MATRTAPDATAQPTPSAPALPAHLTPAVSDPVPLQEQDGDGILEPPLPAPSPNPSSRVPTPGPSTAPQTPAVPLTPAPKPVVENSTDTKVTAAYKRLRSMKVDDIKLLLHPQMKSLDAQWLRRILVSIIGEHQDYVTDATYESDNSLVLTQGKETTGSVLLFTDMVEPLMHVMSALLTKKPFFEMT